MNGDGGAAGVKGHLMNDIIVAVLFIIDGAAGEQLRTGAAGL